MNLESQRFCAVVVLGACLSGLLGACAPMIVGGAVAAGALVATDRRTSGAQLNDQNIELRASGRINQSLGDRVRVSVNSYNGQVLLTGEVPNQQDKQQVEQIVSKVEYVRSIVNDLAVLPISSLTQRSTDSLTTTKVKAAMVDTKDIYANSFKVVTERGTTYLMGRVTQREANRATEVTRSTGGVLKVVRLFEIISEEELQRTLPKPSAAQDTPAAPPKS